MMACIGWGSLIWDKQNLDVDGSGGLTVRCCPQAVSPSESVLGKTHQVHIRPWRSCHVRTAP
jgi:hypothetical protein